MEPTALPHADVQASRPTVHVSLSRVGVTNVEKIIRLNGRDGGREGREGRRDDALTETVDDVAVEGVDATGGELDSVSEEA